jgi:hypothetical protein
MRKDHTHSQDRDINVDWVKRKLSPLLYPVIQQVWREKRLGPQPRPGVLTKESRDRLIKKTWWRTLYFDQEELLVEEEEVVVVVEEPLVGEQLVREHLVGK